MPFPSFSKYSWKEKYKLLLSPPTAYVQEEGSVVSSLVKMAVGNGLGFTVNKENILNETEKILKDLDYKEIELTVAPENEIAINLYKKHGYIQEKFLKDEYGEGIHRYMMRKKL